MVVHGQEVKKDNSALEFSGCWTAFVSGGRIDLGKPPLSSRAGAPR